jgi:hypothetical protein
MPPTLPRNFFSSSSCSSSSSSSSYYSRRSNRGREAGAEGGSPPQHNPLGVGEGAAGAKVSRLVSSRLPLLLPPLKTRCFWWGQVGPGARNQEPEGRLVLLPFPPLDNILCCLRKGVAFVACGQIDWGIS